MALRIIERSGALPMSWPVDPNAEFQHGMVGQLKVAGNNIVCGVSDGLFPIGIIDDVKTNAFSEPVIDEVKIAPAVATMGPGGTLISATDVVILLEKSNVIANSFSVRPIDVQLKPTNGVVVIPAGTELNYDSDNDGYADSFRIVCNYNYYVPNVPGMDSTLGSGKITVWYQRMIAQTDQYEPNQVYTVASNLFVSESGLLTTRQPTPNHPGIAIVTGPPGAVFGMLEFMWL